MQCPIRTQWNQQNNAAMMFGRVLQKGPINPYKPPDTKKLFSSPIRDRLSAGEGDLDGRVVRQCSCVIPLPRGRAGVFVRVHVERYQLPAFDADDFERHRDWTPEP